MRDDRARILQRQIERVLDQGSGDRRQVIVRTADEQDLQRRHTLLSLASDALKQRNMALSARECLPPARASRETPTTGRESRVQRYSSDPEKSLASQVRRRPASRPRAELKAEFLGRIDGVRGSDIVMKALRETRGPVRRAPGHAQPTFWTSKSMLLDMSVGDIQQLPNVPEIRDIYPNRQLKTPRLVEAKALPDAVIEQRASSWGVQRVNALSAWGAYGARGAGVKIGILDTGIDATHPDLKGKVVAWAEFDAEGNPVAGSKPHDSDRHGTHCAGTLVGGSNSGQWIGVAPEAQLAVALVLNGAQGGTDAQVLAGIDWLVEQDVDVISMSLGGLTLDNETPNTYTEAIVTCLREGIPVVTAIGNDGSQTTGSPGNDIFAFAVGATDIRDRAAGFSGGRTHIIRESNFIPDDLLPLPYSSPKCRHQAWLSTHRSPAARGRPSTGRRWRRRTWPAPSRCCSARRASGRTWPPISGPSCCRICSPAPPRSWVSPARTIASASAASMCCGPSASRSSAATASRSGSRPRRASRRNGSTPQWLRASTVPKDTKAITRALDKLQSPELRALVEGGADDPVSVILEVDLPRQQVKVQSREDRLRGDRSVLRGVIEESPEQRRQNAERVAEASAHLEQVLGAPPRWLAAARAFTFKGTPSQLRKIAEFDFTRAVRPNRKLSR